MLRLFAFFALSSSLLLAACGDGSSPPPPLDVSWVEAPVELDTPARYAAGLACGPHDETVFDVFVPEGAERAPLVFYIHGGGLTAGSRTELWTGYEDELEAFLAAGFVVATIDYRLLSEDVDPDGVLKPLGDSARCLQYLRYHANSFGIDSERVVAMGTSAGAGTALWLGTHDDLADREAEDPVLRESTRPSAVVAIETQATYDLLRWSTDVFAEYELDPIEAAEFLGLTQRMLNFYGITDVEDLETPEIQAYRAEVDMLGLMSDDDPPVFVSNVWEDASFPGTVGSLFHHPYHAEAVADFAEAEPIPVVANIPKIGVDASETAVEFARRQLQ